MTFEESVRKRPAMYIGNDGVVGLVAELLNDCIASCKTDKIAFEVSINGDNDYSIGISSDQDLSAFLRLFTIESPDSDSYLPRALKAISDSFEVITGKDKGINIKFSVDKTVITNTNVDYLKLMELILQVALLNRQTEILTIDKRKRHINQNYFHFPQGIFYLFDRATTEVLGKPEFMLTFDGKVGKNKYQIGLAYRSDWYPSPNVNSFANDEHTVCGGSLVNGILDGLISACKTYVIENNLAIFKIKRKKFLNGLIIVSAVRGEEFKYGGSFKETLEDEQVKTQAKKIIKRLTLDYFRNNKDKADKFLVRFDETQLTSKMY